MSTTQYTDVFPIAPVPFNDDESLDLDGMQRVLALLTRILPLINHENRQVGLRACKTVMMEVGVIRSDRVRSPLDPLPDGSREALLELARKLDPVALNWRR